MKIRNNSVPFGVRVDKAARESIVFDRIFRPLVKLRGIWPNVDRKSAVPCSPDEDRLYGAANIYFWRPDDINAPRCCPVVRARLNGLLGSMPVLKEEVERREKAAQAAKPAAPQTHADLIAATFTN